MQLILLIMATVSYLVVAGGGGGGGAYGGGGGGQVLQGTTTVAAGTTYPVVVGAGGTAGNNSNGGNGGASSFNGISAAVGNGGKYYGDASPSVGGASGSGQAGGTTPNGSIEGGGGAGDSAAGTAASGGNGGAGGAGTASSISGGSVVYGSGGGGGANPGSGASGGTNAGNAGDPGGAGTANTGGGGGAGNGGAVGGVGGTGVLIISYATGTLSATGGSITTNGGNTIHTFTVSGNFITATPSPFIPPLLPNPTLRRQDAYRGDRYGFIGPTNLPILFPPPCSVFNRYDWPNPTRARVPSDRFGFVQGNVLPADGLLVLMELNGYGGGWTDVTTDVAADPIVIAHGFQSASPDDLVAAPSTLQLALNNSSHNVGGVIGYYSPDGVTARPGFDVGPRILVQVTTLGAKRTRFLGWIDTVAAAPGLYSGDLTTKIVATSWLTLASETLASTVGVQSGLRGDQLAALLTALPTFPPQGLQFAAGLNAYPYAFDDLGPKSTVTDGLDSVAVSGLDRIFEKSDGTLVYETSAYRQGGAVASLTLTDIPPAGRPSLALTSFPARRDRGTLYTDIQVIVHPRNVDAAAVILYRYLLSASAPSIPASGGSITVLGPFQDPTQLAQKVGGFNMLISDGGAGAVIGNSGSLPTNDWQITTAPNGAGSDISSSCTVTVVYGATGASFVITNNNGAMGYIAKLQCRGQGVYDYQTAIAPATLVPANLTKRSITIDCKYAAIPTVAQTQANTLLFTYGVRRPQLSSPVTLEVPLSDAATYAAVQALEISQAVQVYESVTGLSALFWINHIQESYDDLMNLTMALTLAPVLVAPQGLNVPIVFSDPVASLPITVGTGVMLLRVKAWGAGGGGSNSGAASGAGGGFAQGDVTVTPGETLLISVGGPGVGGGGAAAGSGGGYSAVFRGATPLIVAGGGGGAGVSAAGGSGGGISGTAGTVSGGSGGGGGGSNVAGGAQGSGNSGHGSAGSSLQGGAGDYFSAAGVGAAGGLNGGGNAGAPPPVNTVTVNYTITGAAGGVGGAGGQGGQGGQGGDAGTSGSSGSSGSAGSAGSAGSVTSGADSLASGAYAIVVGGGGAGGAGGSGGGGGAGGSGGTSPSTGSAGSTASAGSTGSSGSASTFNGHSGAGGAGGGGGTGGAGGAGGAAGAVPNVSVDYLLVGGGGAGGDNGSGIGGGGGGGGILVGTVSLAAGSYGVGIGAGGSGNGSNGGNSTWNGLSATGGGAGAFAGDTNGSNGGCGGGGEGPGGGGGTGSQGANGGAGNANAGGGGGGGSTAGATAPSSGVGGAGGAGAASAITGTSINYAGGGGGNGNTGAGSGGIGGGGNGGAGGNPGTAGTNGFGGGGGGGGYAGGSGVVILRYLTAQATSTGGSQTTAGSYTVVTFASNDTFVLNPIGSSGATGGVGGSGGVGATGATGSVVLTYVTAQASSTGGSAVPSGPNTVVTFTASGTFTLTVLNQVSYPGGGGGGGYFGGGGGAGTASAGAGGGGGSSFTSGVNTSNTSGAGATPGNATDTNYGGAAGQGGTGSGIAGRVVLIPIG